MCIYSVARKKTQGLIKPGSVALCTPSMASKDCQLKLASPMSHCSRASPSNMTMASMLCLVHLRPAKNAALSCHVLLVCMHAQVCATVACGYRRRSSQDVARASLAASVVSDRGFSLIIGHLTGRPFWSIKLYRLSWRTNAEGHLCDAFGTRTDARHMAHRAQQVGSLRVGRHN